jgi:predicted Zn-dependent protease
MFILVLTCFVSSTISSPVDRWSIKDNEIRLTWFVSNYHPSLSVTETKRVLNQAFNVWSKQMSIKVKITESSRIDRADIIISWFRGNHGDEYPFDDSGNGSVNVLAHSFYPPSGRIHLDAYENWTSKTTGDGIYFPYVITHEIGHVLGLHHSSKPSSIMNSEYKITPINEIRLDIEDLCHFDWLYNARSTVCYRR